MVTRAAATTTAGDDLVQATTATIRRKLVNLPARIATSARKIHLHLPKDWPWEDAWTMLYEHTHACPLPEKPHKSYTGPQTNPVGGSRPIGQCSQARFLGQCHHRHKASRRYKVRFVE